MATTKKAAKKATPSKEGASPKAKPKAEVVSDVVDVLNISSKQVNTSKSTIEPGGRGQATIAECRSWAKFIKRV